MYRLTAWGVDTVNACLITTNLSPIHMAFKV